MNNILRQDAIKTLKMKDLPNSWNVKQLKSISNVENGIWGKQAEDNGVGVLRSTNFRNNGYVTLDDTAFLDINSKKVKQKKLKKGEILLEISGGSPAQPVGRVVYFEKDTNEDLLFGNFIKKLQIIRDCNSFYVFSVLRRLYSIGRTETLQHQTTGIRNLDYKAYLSLPIPLPPLPEQKKIAAILSTVDKAIEKTDEIIEKTKTLKKGLMQQLLTKGIGHSEFKEVRIGTKTLEIPSKWNLRTLEEITSDKARYGANAASIEYDSKLPRYVRITDISDEGYLKDDEIRSISKKEAEGYYLKTNDIVFARSGATVGKSYLYRDDDGLCAYAGYLIKFIIDPNIIVPEYLFYVTHSPYYYAWVKGITRATSQPNINAQEYSSFELLVPPLPEQKKIASILSTVDQKIMKEQQYKEKLKLLKKALMQKLLTGEVRVNVDEEEVETL